MNRYQHAQCRCGCHWWLVIDTATHRLAGAAENASDATQAADRLNRGIAVAVEDEPELSVRTPRAIVHGLLLGFGAYVAIVAVFAVLS